MADWITTKEAGELLGVNIRTIQRYVEKGKLKAKVIAGKNSVKKEAIAKLKPENQATNSANSETANEQKTSQSPSWQIPDGYLLIDRSTLESLRDQIKKLTDSVGEMQLTQKLLIEKGLNLKENRVEESSLPEATALSSAPSFESSVIDTPIENVAKAHEDFFGKKRSNKLNLLWIIPSIIAGLIILIVIISVFASGPL